MRGIELHYIDTKTHYSTVTQGSNILAYSDRAQPTPLKGSKCGGIFTANICLPELTATGLRVLLIIGAVQSLAALEIDIIVTRSKKTSLKQYDVTFGR